MEKSAEASVNGGGGGFSGEGKTVVDMTSSASGRRRGESLLRVIPMILCVVALIVMIKNSMSNDYGSVSYKDVGGFRYLVYANGMCAGYSLLSALYLAGIFSRSTTTTTTNKSQAWTVFLFDQVFTYVILGAATAGTEVMFLAYKGDEAVTWSSECGVFGGFCHKTTAVLGITFGAVACYFLLSLISSYRLFANYEAPISYQAKGDHENGDMFNPRG